MKNSRIYASLLSIVTCSLVGCLLFVGDQALLKTVGLGIWAALTFAVLFRVNVLRRPFGRHHPFVSPSALIEGRSFRGALFIPSTALATIGWLSLCFAWVGVIAGGSLPFYMGFMEGLHCLLFALFATAVCLWSWGTLFECATRREVKWAAVTGLIVIIAGIAIMGPSE